MYAGFVDKGLQHFQSTPKIPEQSSQIVVDEVRLKVWDVELKQLSLREEELQLYNYMETKRLEFCLYKLELGLASQATANSTDFYMSKNIYIVPPFMRSKSINISCCLSGWLLRLNGRKNCGHCYYRVS